MHVVCQLKRELVGETRASFCISVLHNYEMKDSDPDMGKNHVQSKDVRSDQKRLG